MDCILVEILVGKLEKGEELIVMVKCELEEEIGYIIDLFSYIIFFYILLGFVDELVYFYLVEDLKLMIIKVELDEDEFVEVMEVMVDEVFIFI